MKFDLAKLMKQALDDNKKELRKIAEGHNVTPEKMERFIIMELGLLMSKDEEYALRLIKDLKIDKAMEYMCNKHTYETLLNRKEDLNNVIPKYENILSNKNELERAKERIREVVKREFPYDTFYNIPLKEVLEDHIFSLEELSSLYIQCLGKLKSVNMSDLGE